MTPRPDALAAALAELGRRLRGARRVARLAQRDVAFEAGCDQAYVSLVEHGRRNLTVGTLLAMADALGVNAAVFVTGLHVAEGVA